MFNLAAAAVPERYFMVFSDPKLPLHDRFYRRIPAQATKNEMGIGPPAGCLETEFPKSGKAIHVNMSHKAARYPQGRSNTFRVTCSTLGSCLINPATHSQLPALNTPPLPLRYCAMQPLPRDARPRVSALISP